MSLTSWHMQHTSQNWEEEASRFPHKLSALCQDKTKLPMKQNPRWHGDNGSMKSACLLNPTAIHVDAQLSAHNHSPHDSHITQLPHRKEVTGLEASLTSYQLSDHNVGTSLDLPCSQHPLSIHTNSLLLPLAEYIGEEKGGVDLGEAPSTYAHPKPSSPQIRRPFSLPRCHLINVLQFQKSASPLN